MFEIVLTVAIIAALIILVVVLVARSRRKKASEPVHVDAGPADPFAPGQDTTGDPRRIRPGDILEFGDVKSFVRGSVEFSEGGYTWSEHFFQDDSSAQRRWLSVEEDPDLELAVWQDRPELELQPGAKAIELDGRTYELVERGTATYRTTGTTGLKESGAVDYVDYESADGHGLGFERYDHGRWEVATGESVAQGAFTIYPGS